ncbi:MAG: ABC transporter ATP-binding protein [Pelagibacteraceae bacterium]|nr:ABC transporter ATP-binding protein [Pelagibacteraceae bacterium]
MIQNLKNICSRKHIKYLIILLLGMFIVAAIEMIGLGSIPIFIMIIVDIDVLINKFPTFFANDYIENIRQDYITIFGGIILILIFLLKNIYLSLFLFFQGKVIKILRTDIRNKLFKKYINAPYNFHIENNPSVLIRNLNESVSGTINTILSTLSITRESLILIVIFILLFLNEPIVSVSVFGVLILITGLFMFYTRQTLISRGEQVQFLFEDQMKTMNHTLGSIRETKILNRENYLTNLFMHQVDKIEKHSFFSYFLSQTPRLFLEFIAVFTVALTTIIFVLINLSNEQILPTISLLAVCAIRLIPAFNSIVSSISTRRFSKASLKIVSGEMINVPIEDKFKNKNLIEEKNYKKYLFKDQIKFENVFFSHENSNAKILQNISLEIRRGQKVGIIGKSGAGKSTLIDLILSLIKPIEGKILIDDSNLEYNLRDWQKQIGCVPQDIYLLDDTIKNNIAFGLNTNDINQERILKSIELSRLKDYVSSLEKKENTVVGNRGIRVSGGQKQRIGIARALYHDPKILILDEATSSLDTINERKIMEEIYNTAENINLIIITHRHKSVSRCDKVYLLDNGKIIDEGKYADLEKRHSF